MARLDPIEADARRREQRGGLPREGGGGQRRERPDTELPCMPDEAGVRRRCGGGAAEVRRCCGGGAAGVRSQWRSQTLWKRVHVHVHVHVRVRVHQVAGSSLWKRPRPARGRTRGMYVGDS